MKKYAAWILRTDCSNREIVNGEILKSIRHMIKCTSVRRCMCNNSEQNVIVRETDADIIGRPLFTVMNDKGVVGMAFPTTKADGGDYSIVEQFIDSFQHTNVMTHVATAKRRATPEHKVRKQVSPPGRVEEKMEERADDDGTMVISLVGNFTVMQSLISSVSALARGHHVQMSVINAV